MKITEAKVHICEPEKRYKDTDRMRNCPNGVPGPLGRFGLARILTDEDVEGLYQIEPYNAQAFVAFVKNYLAGKDPYEKDRLMGRFMPFIRSPTSGHFLFYGYPMRVVGTAECCLWDIMGKAAGKPVYKLLGQCRDKLLAYGSSKFVLTLEENIAHYEDCIAEGFRVFKLHPPSTNWTDPEVRRKMVKLDIQVLRAIKKLAGEEITLMHDPVNSYDREVALIVGRELEKLGFYVFEDPVPTSDIEGNAKLCEDLEIPIMLGEDLDDIYRYVELIRNRSADILRCILERIGGITPAIKLAHLAELNNMKMEGHSFGNQATQFAHLQVMLAMQNSDFYETPIPQGTFDTDVIKDTIRIDENGFVHAPTKPGLGFEIDEANLKKRTIEIVS